MIGAAIRPDVRLVEHPGETWSFPQFCVAAPAPAVALDGFVAGPSQCSPDGLHVSLNHHEGGSRLYTRATCGQARLAVAHGLWDHLAVKGVAGADIHVNDADPDVCLSVYVLAHPERLDDPAVERLVAAEDIIDTTGAFWCPPWVDETFLSELAWVFGPYHDARQTGLPTNPAGLHSLIEEMTARVGAHVDGRGGQRPASEDFDVVAMRGAVVAIVEHGPYARLALRRAGFGVVVSERRAGDRRDITIAKASPFRGPDLAAAYERLNQAERCPPDDRWGGSDLIGGSPRRRGTMLPLDAILEIVAGC
jgi:hypothetical protein